MPNKTIPALTAVTAAALTDRFPVRQVGDTEDKRETLTQIRPLMQATLVVDATRSSTSQVFANGVEAEVLFDSETSDPNNWYNPLTGRFQPNVAGMYEIIANVRTLTAETMTTAIASLRKNGSTMGQFVSVSVGSTATSVTNFTLNGKFFFNGTTDYASVFFVQNSGANRSTLAAIDFTNFKVFG